MWPEPLFSLWGWSVNLYVVIVALGALAALELLLFLGWERDISLWLILAMWLVAVAGMLVGGVLLPYWLQAFLPGQGHWSLSMLISGLLGVMILVAANPVWRARMPDLLDVGASAVALGQSIGRFGCFAAGCCYGIPAPGLPWAVTLIGGSSAARYPGLPLHPVQLYEALGCFLIALLLLKLRQQPALRGVLVWVYLLAYGLLRFVIEFYRGDERPMVGILSLNQIICFGFVGIGAIVLARRANWHTSRTASLQTSPTFFQEDKR
jgi:phosphatidylglycerol---prolipoprotein diacylglyceryl transferase